MYFFTISFIPTPLSALLRFISSTAIFIVFTTVVLNFYYFFANVIFALLIDQTKHLWCKDDTLKRSRKNCFFTTSTVGKILLYFLIFYCWQNLSFFHFEYSLLHWMNTYLYVARASVKVFYFPCVFFCASQGFISSCLLLFPFAECDPAGLAAKPTIATFSWWFEVFEQVLLDAFWTYHSANPSSSSSQSLLRRHNNPASRPSLHVLSFLPALATCSSHLLLRKSGLHELFFFIISVEPWELGWSVEEIITWIFYTKAFISSITPSTYKHGIVTINQCFKSLLFIKINIDV